jgi:hypothetical protein
VPKPPDQTSTSAPHPLALIELARRSGKARSTITEAAQGPLRAAKLEDGRIDAAHPAVVKWAISRGLDPAKLLRPYSVIAVRAAPSAAPLHAVPTARTTTENPFDAPAIADELLDLTVRQVVQRFGSMRGFADWIALRRKVADTARLETQNGQLLGTLIPRDFVRTHVLAYVAQAQIMLLRDAAPTIAQRVYALARSGGSLEEAIELVRDLVGAPLKQAKEQAVRALRESHAAEKSA